MADIILVMHSRKFLLCDASNPFKYTAEMTGRGMIGHPAEECVRLFNWVRGHKVPWQLAHKIILSKPDVDNERL